MKAKQAAKNKATKQAALTMKEKIGREALAWFWVGLVFLLIKGAVDTARVNPYESMQNTLLVGDHLIMSRMGYDAGIPFTNWHVPLWRNPKRGQIVIFRAVVPGDNSDIIKRVIGLPGETVDVREGAVWINGTRLREDYTVGRTEPADPSMYRAALAGQTRIFPYTVPPDCYFVMGDNRGNSLDSRFEGCIPRGNIIGTPLMIYMSIDTPSESWGSGAIGDRISAYANALLHPSEIRWHRLFRLF